MRISDWSSDVCSSDLQASAIQVIDTAVEEFGSCDIVINSAGILRDRTFENMSEDEYEAVMQGHATGPFFLTQAAFRQMKVQGYGRVVFTSSAAGLFGNFGQSNYALAKNGIVGITKVIAREGARHGILVTEATQERGVGKKGVS